MIEPQKMIVKIDKDVAKKIDAAERKKLFNSYLTLYSGFAWVNWTKKQSLGRAWQTALGQCEEFLKNKTTSEYDKYGNTILETKYNNYKDSGVQYGEITEEYEYGLEYDEDGIVIKRTTYLNGVLHWDTTYKDPIVLYEPRERE